MANPLDILGWKPVDENLVNLVINNDKIILLFPHTSYSDMLIAASYLSFEKRVNEIRDRFRTVIDEHVLEIPFLNVIGKYMNAITVSKSEGGFVESTYKSLVNKDKYILMISPKGAPGSKRWRSGWYYLAKRLGACVIAAGPDYVEHTMRSHGDGLYIKDHTYEEAEAIMKENMSHIAPYNKCHDTKDIRSTSLLSNENKYAYISLLLFLGITTYLSTKL